MHENVALVSQGDSLRSGRCQLERVTHATLDGGMGVDADLRGDVAATPTDSAVRTLGVLADEDEIEAGKRPEVHVEIESFAQAKEDAALEHAVRDAGVTYG